MNTVYPEDRRSIELSLPPDWTIFNPEKHERFKGMIASLEDLTGWTAEAEGLECKFGISPASALWGAVGTFVEIAPASEPGHVTLRPPSPIPIPKDADMFELWVSGDSFDWRRKGGLFSLELVGRKANMENEIHVVLAEYILWPTYSVRIIRIPEELRCDGIVTGLRFSGNDSEFIRRFNLDKLCAYRDIRRPLVLSPRPKRPLMPRPGMNVGLHTGPGRLAFPVREETILPDNLTQEFTTSINRQGDSFHFQYSGHDVKIDYAWLPLEDPFRVSVRINGCDAVELMADASLGGVENAAWLASEWHGTYANEEPLPVEFLLTIPSRLSWRGEEIPQINVSGENSDKPTIPSYDIGKHSELPIYHLFREIIADKDVEVPIEIGSPSENIAVWINGVLVSAKRKQNKMAYGVWNSTWTLHLKPGRNVLAIRLVFWLGGFFELNPLSGNAKWSGSWRVFGPSPYIAGARCPATLRFNVQSLTLKDKVAAAVFDAGQFGELTVRMQLMAKSIVVDYCCPSGNVALLDPGKCRKLKNGRVHTVPAMRANGILLADMAGRTVFFSHLHDWYRSNASTWASRISSSHDEASLQGPLCYLPKTDGIRNSISERYFLTCSPVYEEVLPNIPNPASPWAVEIGRYVFQASAGPMSFEKELDKVRRWAALGMTDILHLHHEAGWSYKKTDPLEKNPLRGWINDGCTLRLDIAPHKGGNEAMSKFIAAEQELGLRVGLYTNYTDYYPLNTKFFSDRTILRPDGSRQTAWVHSYKMKPSLAVEYDEWFAPRIARRFHPDAAYTDVHTSIAPWDRVDYDEMIPGAGTFAATYYSDGEILLNDQRHYCGPVFSEGGLHHWMYAGLVSGNYGQIGVNPDDPPDPAFNLLKVHPLATDAGLSVDTNGWIYGEEKLEEQVDRYLLALLTYGHIAYLPQNPFDQRLLLRIYHMSRAVSMACAGIRPVSINYIGENGQCKTVSELHACGLDNHCRLKISYPGNKVLYANWSKTEPWILNGVSKEQVILPGNGYLFDTPEGPLCSSSSNGNIRCDRAQTPNGWYVDGRGREATSGPLTACGSAVLLVDSACPGFYRLIDGGGNTAIRIGRQFAPSHYRVISIDNEVLADRVADSDDSGAVIKILSEAVRYEWQG